MTPTSATPPSAPPPPPAASSSTSPPSPLGRSSPPWSWSFAARTIVVPAVLAALAGVVLHRSLSVSVLASGIGIGLLAGMMVGFTPVVLRSRPLWGWIAAAAIIAGAFAAAAQTWHGPLTIPSTLGNFLVVRLPASGLNHLAVIPTLVVLPATAAAVGAARRGWTMLSIAVPMVALLLACTLVVPVGSNPIVVILFVATAAFALLLDARRQSTEIEPLVGASSADHRHVFGVHSLIPITVALALAAGAVALPMRSALDVRGLVVADAIEVRDPNPLAVTARLRLNAGLPADVSADSVSVSGDSPGRLRLAVLDRYTADGWEQDATYAVTGSALDPGPILARDPADEPARTTVTVVPGSSQSLFAGVPTGGSPISVLNPNGVRYSSTAGVLLGKNWQSPVTYQALVRSGQPPTVVEAPSELASPDLSQCPSSDTLRRTASVLVDGVVSPLDRLARIDAWLKLQRIYDPTAPGGQTLRSVERFLEQNFARGNLEMFVTAYALLARCAGVAVRIVVGYLPPSAGTTTKYLASDIDAWIETPLARSGWVSLDPIPTPAEQQRQAQVARQPKAAPPPDVPANPEPPARKVAPLAGGSISHILAWSLLAALLGTVALLAAWAFGLPALTDRRRRRSRDADAAVLGAWSSVTDRLVDTRISIGSHWTPTETVQHTNGLVPFGVTRTATELWPIVDIARFGGDLVTPEHAERSWALRDEIVRIFPGRRTRALQTLAHPIRAWRRLRAARRVAVGRVRWSGALPEELLATTRAGAIRVNGVDLVTLIGSGSTSDVYRARRVGDDHPVAVKVFNYTVDDSVYAQQRFEWEARVAKLVSGMTNLPEIYDSGTTDGGLPYLTMKLYEHGTLFHRVRRGGPISLGEVRIAGQELAIALETLHQNSILHGDIKPENIFIDDDGLVLGDLGSAWLRADGGPAAGMTPPYAAPEVWRGQAPTVASDIYSLGLTLLFAASGRVPVAGVAIDIVDITEAFGDADLAPLFEVDPRRRPRRAIDIARLLGAEVDSPLAATSGTLSLPNPTFTYHPTA